MCPDAVRTKLTKSKSVECKAGPFRRVIAGSVRLTGMGCTAVSDTPRQAQGCLALLLGSEPHHLHAQHDGRVG